MRFCQLLYATSLGLLVAANDQPPAAKITTAPAREHVLELVKRQSVNDLPTCGYYNGSPNSALTCSGGRPCGYATADGWFGCCSTTSVDSSGRTRPAQCPVVTDCVDSAYMSLCTGSCPTNTLIRKCTDAASPYCAIITMIELPITAFLCATTPFVEALNVDSTGAGGGIVSRTTTGVPAFLTSTNGLVAPSPGFSGLMGGSSSSTTTPAPSTVIVTAGQSSSAAAAPTNLAGRVEMLAAGMMALLNIL